jgi:hypothetical protein
VEQFLDLLIALLQHGLASGAGAKHAAEYTLLFGPVLRRHATGGVQGARALDGFPGQRAGSREVAALRKDVHQNGLRDQNVFHGKVGIGLRAAGGLAGC